MLWLMRNPVNIIDTGNVYPSYFEFISHFGFTSAGYTPGFTPKKDDLDNWNIVKRGKHLDSRDTLYLLILEKGYGKNKRRIVIGEESIEKIRKNIKYNQIWSNI